MADTKISDLTALTGANVEQTADVLPIVDTSVTTNKKILVSELAQALEVLATEQASTSGTSIDFTSIPAWVKRITVQFVGVSTNGTSGFLIQIGDSGGIETSGYTSVIGIGQSGVTWVMATSTAGFRVGDTNPQAGATYHGHVTLVMEDSTNFTWTLSGNIGNADATATIGVSAGSKSLSAALDRVRITTVNGTDTFDAGAINILYE